MIINNDKLKYNSNDQTTDIIIKSSIDLTGFNNNVVQLYKGIDPDTKKIAMGLLVGETIIQCIHIDNNKKVSMYVCKFNICLNWGEQMKKQTLGPTLELHQDGVFNGKKPFDSTSYDIWLGMDGEAILIVKADVGITLSNYTSNEGEIMNVHTYIKGYNLPVISDGIVPIV